MDNNNVEECVTIKYIYICFSPNPFERLGITFRIIDACEQGVEEHQKYYLIVTLSTTPVSRRRDWGSICRHFYIQRREIGNN